MDRPSAREHDGTLKTTETASFQPVRDRTTGGYWVAQRSRVGGMPLTPS